MEIGGVSCFESLRMLLLKLMYPSFFSIECQKVVRIAEKGIWIPSKQKQLTGTFRIELFFQGPAYFERNLWNLIESRGECNWGWEGRVANLVYGCRWSDHMKSEVLLLSKSFVPIQLWFDCNACLYCKYNVALTTIRSLNWMRQRDSRLGQRGALFRNCNCR